MYKFGFQNLLNENFHVYIRNFSLLGQIFVCWLFFVCFEMGSHYVACPGTQSVDQTGLKLTEVCLYRSPECVLGMFNHA